MPLPFPHLAIPDADALRAAIPRVNAAIQRVSDRACLPWAPGKPWTCAQMAWHLADAESVMLDRVRRLLSLENASLPSIPQNIWVAQLPPRPLETAALLFAACRTTTADLIASLGSVPYERCGLHPEYGPMTLADVLRHLHGHALHHAQQLEAV